MKYRHRCNTNALAVRIFHGARPVKYRHRCDTNALAVRIFHGASCKGAKDAKSGKKEFFRNITVETQRAQRINFLFSLS